MNIAPSVQDFLAEQQIGYELCAHPRTASSLDTARLAHVPPRQLAKAVVLKDESGYLVAAVPSCDHIAGTRLAAALHRHALRLATEWEVATLFADCDYGAVPPLGEPYALPLIVDEALDSEPEVYFEAGDHEHLVHLTHAEFFRMTASAPRAHFTRPNEQEDKPWMR
jgi:Ala-tRNA(Pro) deacylase